MNCLHPSAISILLMAAVTIPSVIQAQGPRPTHRDVAYDTQHRAQVLDVYENPQGQVVPAVIYIHGGGWQAGDKRHVPKWLLGAVRLGNIAAVSVEYRFTDVAPHPAQVNDCVRAVQFVRANARKWKIDPNRIAIMGGSAGGHLALWVGLQDDQADPSSHDPIARQSSRVTCIASFAGPTDFSLLEKYEHRHPGYYGLLGVKLGTSLSEIPDRLGQSVSPITFATRDDPPVILVHGGRDDVVPLEHATLLHQKLQDLGVESKLDIHPTFDHRIAGASPEISKPAILFLAQKLGIPIKRR